MTNSFSSNNSTAPVKIYPQANYQGAYQGLWAGQYNLNSFPVGVGNDKMRSIEIADGWAVDIFLHDHYSPDTTDPHSTLTTSQPSLDSTQQGTTTLLVYKKDGSREDAGGMGGWGPFYNKNWVDDNEPLLLKSMATNNKVSKEISIDLSLLTAAAGGVAVGGYHVQGIGRYGFHTYIVLSGFLTGYLIIHDASPGQNKSHFIQLTIPDVSQGHPCNLQISGNFLIITVETDYGTLQNIPYVSRGKTSHILLYNLLPDPYNPKLIKRIKQEGGNSGGAGLAYHPGQQRWYIFAEYDPGSNAKMRLYKSSAPWLLSSTTWDEITLNAHWKSLGTGAGTCLVTAEDNSIWALYFTEADDDDKRDEVVSLYKVVEPNGSIPSQRVIKEIIIDRYDIPSGITGLWGATELVGDTKPSMRYGAGLSVIGGTPHLVIAERNIFTDFNYDLIKLNGIGSKKVIQPTVNTITDFRMWIGNVSLKCTKAGENDKELEINHFILTSSHKHDGKTKKYTWKKSTNWTIKEGATRNESINIQVMMQFDEGLRDERVQFHVDIEEDDGSNPLNWDDDMVASSTSITVGELYDQTSATGVGQKNFTIHLKHDDQKIDVSFVLNLTRHQYLGA